MSLSAETEARLEAVVAAAGQPFARHCLKHVRSGLWRWTREHTDLALKLFDGPNADERLRTEAALCRELTRVGAPVPSFVAADSGALALARPWVPGTTLYRRLLAANPDNQSAAVAVRDAWLQLVSALAPWKTRIASTRRESARRKRCMELAAVAQAVADSLPTLPADAIHTLSHTVSAGDLAVLPLDASPSNIIIDGDWVTFIDLELLGLDFADWTYAKYVSGVDANGIARSLAASHPEDSAPPGLDAAVTLLALARAAGLWDAPPIPRTSLVDVLPGRSRAARRIREELGLESDVTSDSG